jgi:hypothetical protein
MGIGSPKAKLVALRVNARIAAFRRSVNFLRTLPALAIIITPYAVLTAKTLAVNSPLLEFAGTVIVSE